MNKKVFSIIFLVSTGCIALAWADTAVFPSYAIKSAVKLALFIILPVTGSFIDRRISLPSLFTASKKGILFSLLLGIAVYFLILIAYFIAGQFFDFSNITTELEENINVNKSNFVYVALYISFVNSFLEEFFFRGFAFLALKQISGRRTAYIFSAAAFALYHIAIMKGWFSPLLFILLIAGLFFAGLIFNWLDEKHNNIYTSWIVHAFANFSINTIGFMLF
jgi:membrane protease YdiL (CAAX protease family)